MRKTLIDKCEQVINQQLITMMPVKTDKIFKDLLQFHSTKKNLTNYLGSGSMAVFKSQGQSFIPAVSQRNINESIDTDMP